ncbi:MAG: T9SS type A sorting domain-containing protein [Candidatus Stahlbacteria bacterium]|nr:T9SS type A sorting domain-containing protein [Candidatus Stahlbacteria bacterium]
MNLHIIGVLPFLLGLCYNGLEANLVKKPAVIFKDSSFSIYYGTEIPAASSGDEIWELEAGLRIQDSFAIAPSAIRLGGDSVRLYYVTRASPTTPKYIASAISTDSINFTVELGHRLDSGPHNSVDEEASHPWVIAVGDTGFRMYYQSRESLTVQPPKFRVMSAWSTDGLNFVKEGVRIDIFPNTAFSLAGHGRVTKIPDGTLKMFFSGNLASHSHSPSNIFQANSDDGLTWTLDTIALYLSGHDPTVLNKLTAGAMKLYFRYLLENILVAESNDGVQWPDTVDTVQFVDQFENPQTWVEDVDILEFADGSQHIYSNCHKSGALWGIASFKKVSPGVQEKTIFDIPPMLFQNLPNPFTQKTVIRYQMPEGRSQKSDVRIEVYDLVGRLVKTFSLTSNPQSPITSVVWDGKNDSGERVCSGVYFYKLKVGDKSSQTKKLVRLR